MGWWPSNDSSKPSGTDKAWHEHAVEHIISLTPKAEAQLQKLHDDLSWSPLHSVLLGTTCLGSFLLGVRFGRVRPFWRPIRDLQDLSRQDIGPKAPWLRGRVVSVTDGDTIRFVHQPTWLMSLSSKKSDRLALRLCTIDTPETAKFGNPGQPYGEEAKEQLTQLCLNQIVFAKVLQRDQYGRGVAEICKPFGVFFRTYLDESMLRAGLAEVYMGSGAVYGRLGKERYLQLMEKARQAGKGMWSDTQRETAAEYKKRIKAGKAS